MTQVEAWEFERRWGSPGFVEEGWVCCRRCGEAYPYDTPRFWANTHRIICSACRKDELRGIWPYIRAWHRKNRWTRKGELERRCCGCRKWKPLTSFYLLRRNGKVLGVDPLCTRCRVERAKRQKSNRRKHR